MPTLDQVACQVPSLDKTDIIFQQDNDRKHTSKLTKEWLASREIQTMIWPSQSPDLNPIEHLWGQLKRRLGDYQEQPKGMHELWARIEEIWSTMDAESCQTLIESMPSRVAAVVKSKGGHTKYWNDALKSGRIIGDANTEIERTIFFFQVKILYFKEKY